MKKHSVKDAWSDIQVGDEVSDFDGKKYVVKRLQRAGETDAGGGGTLSHGQIFQQPPTKAPRNVMILKTDDGGERHIGEDDFGKWTHHADK